jgi:O-antigen ligase
LYVFQVIRPEELYLPLYPEGRSLYFKLTPLLILGIAMIVTWVIKMLMGRVKTDWLILILLISVLTRLVSGFEMKILPWWVEIGMMTNNLALVVWWWWTSNYLKSAKKKDREYFWKYLGEIIKVSIIIGSLLVLIQTINGSVLGLVVEQMTTLAYLGADSVGSWLIRVVGIWNHPNEAAYYILFWSIAWLLIRIKLGDNLKEILKKWLLLPLLALICLQSRTVYLAMVPIIFWGVYFYRDKINIKKLKEMRIKGGKLWLIMGILFLAVMVMGDRFLNLLTNFGENSGWDTREKLVVVATNLTKKHLWWGVGDGNFIPVAFREDLTGIMKTFPEAVHNGGLLILTEEGLVGVVVWIFFMMVFIKYWWSYTKKNLKLRWLLLGSLWSQFIVMTFQPFSNILMANFIVGVLLLANEAKLSK